MLDERFWNKVKVLGDDDCWEWQATKTHNGYGKFWNGVTMKRAHRLVYAEIHGEIPEGMVILHKCDNPGCVNPNHLDIGTQKENLADARAKGRRPAAKERIKKERIKKSRARVLDKQSVLEIYKSNETGTILAKRYNISEMTVSMIKRGKTWTWLTSTIN